jgi:hypothetical protein
LQPGSGAEATRDERCDRKPDDEWQSLPVRPSRVPNRNHERCETEEHHRKNPEASLTNELEHDLTSSAL